MEKSTITSISLPASLDKELTREAKREHRTKSGMIQEAIRFFLESRKWKLLQQDISLRASRLGIGSDDDIEKLIDEIRE
ncbi:ribbon-helix-helix protein, CopG family [Deltaproteobacteria bacterium PRO3]|nr:ribbon-helix-helix protein, CopG family [Deltaproteobacteria bacterium PRO3]